MELVLDINELLFLLLQEEKLCHVGRSEPKVLVVVSEGHNFSRSRGRGRGRGSRGASHSSRGRTFRGRDQSSKTCSFCGKTGHLVDMCYKKHKYPPHLKQRSANNFTTSEDFDDVSGVIPQKEVGRSLELTFTPKQKKALLALPQHDKS